MKLMTALKIFFHISGLSCLGGAVFLGLLVFYNVSILGSFYGIEFNPLVSFLEFSIMLYAAGYLTFLAGNAIFNYNKRE